MSQIYLRISTAKGDSALLQLPFNTGEWQVKAKWKDVAFELSYVASTYFRLPENSKITVEKVPDEHEFFVEKAFKGAPYYQIFWLFDWNEDVLRLKRPPTHIREGFNWEEWGVQSGE